MNEEINKTSPSVAAGRAKLLTVLGLFILPLIGAFIWYYGLGAAWIAGSSTNHATLIQPAVPLEDFTNLQLDNTEVTLTSLQHKWTIVHRLGDNCQQSCETALYNTRQTRKALGRDSTRIQRLLLGNDVALMDEIKKQHSDLALVLRVVGGLDTQLAPLATSHQLGINDALLIDPLGNVMMAIPVDLAPGKLLKDLKKLLKLSRIG